MDKKVIDSVKGTFFLVKWIRIGALLTGVSCLFLFQLIGSKIDEAGVIREPFFLLPLGYLFLFLGAILFLFHFIAARVVKEHRSL